MASKGSSTINHANLESSAFRRQSASTKVEWNIRLQGVVGNIEARERKPIAKGFRRIETLAQKRDLEAFRKTVRGNAGDVVAMEVHDAEALENGVDLGFEDGAQRIGIVKLDHHQVDAVRESQDLGD